MSDPVARLRASIEEFEGMYRAGGAGGSIAVVNPKSGNHTNAVLAFVPHRGLTVTLGDGAPVPVNSEHVPVGLLALAAQSLPELAKTLDSVQAQIRIEVDAANAALDAWFEEAPARPANTSALMLNDPDPDVKKVAEALELARMSGGLSAGAARRAAHALERIVDLLPRARDGA